MTSPARLRIDFVSDVACPWCAIGLAGLQKALANLEGDIEAEIHLQPFELNPQLPREGEDADEHLMRKYGIGEAQLDANRAAIRERAAPLGVAINTTHGSRVWNTFDAHRLLHWAGLEDPERALALKQALFRAYFTDGEDVADRGILARIAGNVGLDGAQARRVLAEDVYADEVRAQERQYQQAGIHSVPRDDRQREMADLRWPAAGNVRKRVARNCGQGTRNRRGVAGSLHRPADSVRPTSQPRRAGTARRTPTNRRTVSGPPSP